MRHDSSGRAATAGTGRITSRPHGGAGTWLLPAVGLLLLVLIVPVGLGSAASSSTTRDAVSASAAPAPAVTYPTPIHHVILIVDENEAPGEVVAHAPYVKNLANSYAQAGNFYAIRPDSEPAYLAMTSGIAPDHFLIGGYPSLNIGDLTQAAGETWGAYFQSMPSNCYTGGDIPSAGYKATHNPFVQYHDIVTLKTKGNAYCASHVQTMDEWNQTVQNGTVPNFSLIVPDMFNDMNNSSFAAGNAWLDSFIPTILNQPWYNSTAIFLTFDESRTPPIAWNGTTGGHVLMVMISPYARLGYNSTVNYTQYSMLTTTEWLLGLGSTGQNDSWASYPPMKDLFTFSSARSGTTYSVSGNVESNATSSPIAGATVQVAGSGFSGTTTTSSSGAFTFNLPNGSYELSASAPGFLTGNLFTAVTGGPDAGLVIGLSPIPPGEYMVSGTVSNLSGGPISGATITYSGGSLSGQQGLIASSEGAFSVVLPNGTYSFTASQYGYTAASQPVDVNGANQVVNFQLSTYPYGVSGTVSAVASGAAVSGAAVYLNGSGLSVTLVSGSSGEFATMLPNGTYTVVVDAAGFATYSSSFVINGQPVTLSIQLATPSSPGAATQLMNELTQPWVIALIVAVIAAGAATAYVLSRRGRPKAPPA